MQVKGLAFNQLSPNLLASGGADGDIIIWDVANPRKPTAFPPLKVSQKAVYSTFETLVSLLVSWLSCIALYLILVRPTCRSKSSLRAKATLQRLSYLCGHVYVVSVVMFLWSCVCSHCCLCGHVSVAAQLAEMLQMHKQQSWALSFQCHKHS